MISWNKYPNIKPEHNQLVLCYDKHGNMFFEYFQYGAFCSPSVTHWAESPNPPEE